MDPAAGAEAGRTLLPAVEQLAADRVGVAGAQGPALQAVAPDGLLLGPAEQSGGLAVPVREHPVTVHGGETDLHAVQQDGEQPRIGVDTQGRPLGVHSAHLLRLLVSRRLSLMAIQPARPDRYTPFRQNPPPDPGADNPLPPDRRRAYSVVTPKGGDPEDEYFWDQ
jgi:hypothetical protein